MKKVTIQGVAGCYHDAAAHLYFNGEEIQTIECETFPAMFDTLSTDASLLGIVAIENTIAGSLLQNHEPFERLSSGLEKLTETTSSLSNLTSVVSVNKTYADEMVQMTNNLNQLNQFYVNQLQVSKAQTEAGVKLQEDVNKIMETLSSSLESSQKYRKEIDDLSEKVSALNRMYGQMLAAMQNAQPAKN